MARSRKSRIVVPPRQQPAATHERWSVLREDPETREVEHFIIECKAGFFPSLYRAQGLVDGAQPYDFYLDLEEGRMERQLLFTL